MLSSFTFQLMWLRIFLRIYYQQICLFYIIIFEMLKTFRRVYKFANIRQRIRLQRQSRLNKGTEAKNLTTKSQDDISKIRNIGIIAHIDAGKTTTTQRMLYYAGALPSPGDIDQGTTTMDFLAQERERGITIRSAAISFNWLNHQINLIDTPGHVDFSGQVTRSLRVLDGVVTIIDGVKGVEAQTQKVWAQATKNKIPKLCFINKMDRIGSSSSQSLASMRQKLGIQPLLLQIPVGDGDSFKGIVDLIQIQQMNFLGKYGQQIQRNKIAKNTQKHNHYLKLRQKIVQIVANYNQQIGDLYLKQEYVPSHKLKTAIRKILTSQHSSKVTPVLLGASVRNIGVQPLLDAIVSYLPSPLQREQVHSVIDESIKRKPAKQQPFLGYVFKVLFDLEKGPLAYTRIYSGYLNKNFEIYNSSKKFSEKISQVLRVRANQYVPIHQISAGDIVALSGLKQTVAGDTITKGGDQFLLQNLQSPNPIFTAPFQLQTAKHKRQFDQAINKSIIQDTTLSFTYQTQTNQYLVSGLGELHLQILKDRLIAQGIPIKMGKLKINFKQTINQTLQDNIHVKKQLKPNVYEQFNLTIKISPYRNSEGKIEKTNQIIFTFDKVAQFDQMWSQFCKKKILAKNPNQKFNYSKQQLSKLRKNVRNPTPVEPMQEYQQELQNQDQNTSIVDQKQTKQQDSSQNDQQQQSYYHINTLPFQTLYELVETCKTSLLYGRNKLPAVGIKLQIKGGKYKRSSYSKSVMNRSTSSLIRRMIDSSTVLIQPIMEFTLEGQQSMIEIALKDVLKKRGRVEQQTATRLTGFIPAQGVRGWITQLRSMGLQIQLKFNDYQEVIGVNPQKLIQDSL